jgi:transposase
MKTTQPEQPIAKRKRKAYTKEFKEEAVRLAKQISARQAASDLNINATMLRDWVRTLGAEGPEAFRGQGNRTVLDAEMTRMRREITILRQERDILKKAAEFWVKECS